MNSDTSLSFLSKTNLFNAYHVLFGYDKSVSIELLKQLQPPALKAVYWKKALETHPDRSKVLGKVESEMDEQFKEVTLAYENLNFILKDDRIDTLDDETGIQRKSPERSAKVNKKRGVSDHFYKAWLPKRRLLIGQFLYYSGYISWRNLIDAIIWQKRQRPVIGQIALNWGILTAYDIRRILTERNIEQRYKEKFGEYACSKGYITSLQHLALLGKQRLLQRPIGEYFIEQGILYARKIDEIVAKQKVHNRCAWESK